MERNRLLLQYRAAHNNAIRNFDFDSAREIMAEIRRLQMEGIFEEYYQQMDKYSKQFQTIQGQKEQAFSNYLNEHEQIRQKYLERFHAILQKHEKQINDLQEDKRAAIEREKTRPVPEALDLFNRAQLIGRVDHQYENAKILYNEGCYIRDLITRRRIKACSDLYKEQQDQLEMKQNQELQVFLDRIINEFQQFECKHYHHSIILNNRERIKECKAGCWPPENYTVGPFNECQNASLNYYYYDFAYSPDIPTGIPRPR